MNSDIVGTGMGGLDPQKNLEEMSSGKHMYLHARTFTKDIGLTMAVNMYSAQIYMSNP